MQLEDDAFPEGHSRVNDRLEDSFVPSLVGMRSFVSVKEWKKRNRTCPFLIVELVERIELSESYALFFRDKTSKARSTYTWAGMVRSQAEWNRFDRNRQSSRNLKG